MAQIFVVVLGASSFTFAEATWTQALPDWIDAHVRAFEAIGGVPELVVPDNARTAIVTASFYDPEVNRTYAEMAAHYRTAILPARPIIDEEIKVRNEGKREVFAEAKGEGFDVKVLKEILRLRKQDKDVLIPGEAAHQNEMMSPVVTE